MSFSDGLHILYVHESPLMAGGSGENSRRKLELISQTGHSTNALHLHAVGWRSKLASIARTIRILLAPPPAESSVVYARLTAASYLLCLGLAGRVPLVLEMNGYFEPTKPLARLQQRWSLADSTFAGDFAFEQHARDILGAESFLELPLGVTEPLPAQQAKARSGAIWMGFMTEGQGLFDLVQAWVRAETGTVLKLVGDGPLYQPLQEQVRQLSATDHFQFTGRVRHAEARALLNESALALACYQPSLGEGHPLSSLKTLDYLMHCPTVVTVDRDTALRDLDEAGSTGVVIYDGSGPEALEQSIRAAIEVGLVADEVIAARRASLLAARGPQAQATNVAAVIEAELKRFQAS